MYILLLHYSIDYQPTNKHVQLVRELDCTTKNENKYNNNNYTHRINAHKIRQKKENYKYRVTKQSHMYTVYVEKVDVKNVIKEIFHIYTLMI